LLRTLPPYHTEKGFPRNVVRRSEKQGFASGPRETERLKSIGAIVKPKDSKLTRSQRPLPRTCSSLSPYDCWAFEVLFRFPFVPVIKFSRYSHRQRRNFFFFEHLFRGIDMPFTPPPRFSFLPRFPRKVDRWPAY